MAVVCAGDELTSLLHHGRAIPVDYVSRSLFARRAASSDRHAVGCERCVKLETLCNLTTSPFVFQVSTVGESVAPEAKTDFWIVLSPIFFTEMWQNDHFTFVFYGRNDQQVRRVKL